MSSAIRVGLIGVGRAGWGMHRHELSKRSTTFRFVAAADPDARRTERMAEEFPGLHRYACAEELVSDPEVELVDVASPTAFHVEHALLALRAGKHVFLEKPVAITLADAERLCDGARDAAGRLLVRHNRRFEPAFQHIREILATGAIGEVYEVKLRRHGYQRRDDWQAIAELGGGQLLNWGPHIVDHALQFLGSPVRSQWSDLKRIAALGDAEDHLKIVLTGENGRIVDLEISGGVAIPEPVYAIFGTRGALTSDERTIRVRRLDPSIELERREADPGTPPMDGAFGRPSELQWIDETVPVAPAAACDTDSIWDHVYATLRQGVEFPITLEEALSTMRVIEHARQGAWHAAGVGPERPHGAARRRAGEGARRPITIASA